MRAFLCFLFKMFFFFNDAYPHLSVDKLNNEVIIHCFFSFFFFSFDIFVQISIQNILGDMKVFYTG